jgi:Ser/Thr protein kinase RdoA (MazF antagonist)
MAGHHDLTPIGQRALGAALAVAEGLGMRVGAPLVLHDGSNLLVHLAPAPVVARVPNITGAVRPGAGWLEREVAIAAHLARRGAPAVGPAPGVDPGPHEHDGVPVTLWELVEAVPGPVDAHRAGRGLRECHEALADFDGDLPENAMFREAQAIVAGLVADGTLAPEDAALLDRIGRALEARLGALDVPVQALHGDAHLRNVIQTVRGPLWNDFVDTFRGPRAWDLACLDAWARVFGYDPEPVAAALAAYGPPGDPAVLELMVDTRAYVGAAWTILHAPRRPDGAARIAERLAWLRAHEADATR